MNVKIFSDKLSGTDHDKEIRKRMQEHCDQYLDNNLEFMQQAETDALIEAGDPSALNRLGFSRILPNLDMYTFNKARRITSFVSGMQRQERKTFKYTPSEYGDQKTADQFTKIIFNIFKQENVLETFSDAFQSSLITGLTLLQLWVDYRKDPLSGDIKVQMCPYNSFIIAPFTLPDLSDCPSIFKRTYVTKRECISLLPEYKEDIESIVISSAGQDDLFPYLTNEVWDAETHLAYDEFYYKDLREAKILVNVITGETIEYYGKDDERLERILEQPQIELRIEQVPTVRLAVLVNGHVFYDILNPTGDSYPFIPVFGYTSKQVNTMALRYQGLIRGQRDSIFLYNLMTSLEVEFIQTRINPIVTYKPTSMIDDKALKKRDLSNGIALKRTALMGDVQITSQPEIPSSLPLIREQVGKEIIQNDIGNEEMLGTSTDNIAGVQEALRQKSGSTVLAPLFDSLDRSLYIVGKNLLKLIQLTYTPGKVARIIEEEPSDEFYNKAFAKYDCVVEDGVLTSTQRQLQFSTMLAMKGIDPELIPNPMLLKASTIQNKQEIIDYIEQIAQQEQQAAEQEKQVQMQMQQDQSQMINAKASYDLAGAQERIARIEDNRTQALSNLAEANKDDEQASLDRIKAMKELETIDFANLEKLIRLVDILKVGQQNQAEQKLSKPVEVKGE